MELGRRSPSTVRVAALRAWLATWPPKRRLGPSAGVAAEKRSGPLFSSSSSSSRRSIPSDTARPRPRSHPRTMAGAAGPALLGAVRPLLNRDGVHRAAQAAHEGLGRGLQEELVGAV